MTVCHSRASATQARSCAQRRMHTWQAVSFCEPRMTTSAAAANGKDCGKKMRGRTPFSEPWRHETSAPPTAPTPNAAAQRPVTVRRIAQHPHQITRGTATRCREQKRGKCPQPHIICPSTACPPCLLHSATPTQARLCTRTTRIMHAMADAYRASTVTAQRQARMTRASVIPLNSIFPGLQHCTWRARRPTAPRRNPPPPPALMLPPSCQHPRSLLKAYLSTRGTNDRLIESAAPPHDRGLGGAYV